MDSRLPLNAKGVKSAHYYRTRWRRTHASPTTPNRFSVSGGQPVDVFEQAIEQIIRSAR
jgi:hypothetical protein